MTLTLTPDTEARVRSVAELRGQDPEEAMIALLNQALAEAEADFAPIVMSEEETQQVLVALQKSEKDIEAGRWISLEDYEAKLRASVEDHAAGRSMTIEEYRVKALARRQERDSQYAATAATTAGLTV